MRTLLIPAVFAVCTFVLIAGCSSSSSSPTSEIKPPEPQNSNVKFKDKGVGRIPKGPK